MKHVAVYSRVSTDAQFEEGYSMDAQKELITSYCKSKNIGPVEFYDDGGFSGSNIERPEMQRLIEDSKNGLISHVVVYKLDRLSRSQKDTLYLIEDVFLPHGVDFISINESFDTSTPFGKAMMGILSVFAQLERENIRMRTRMGMKERVKSGLWMGGGRVPFGYDYDSNKGILVPNKDADTVRKIYDLYLKGYSTGRIAQVVGMKYDRLVIQILTRESNTGYIIYNGEKYEGQHEGIISEETYNLAMEAMQQRSVVRSTGGTHLLSGFLICGRCKAKMRYQKWGNAGDKIICYSQHKSKDYLIKDINCDNDKVWADDVEKEVLKGIFSLSKEIRNSSTVVDSDSVMDILQQNRTVLAQKIKKLYNLYAASEDEILLETIEENKKELVGIERQITSEATQNTKLKEMKRKREVLGSLESVWEYMTTQEKREVLRGIVKNIEIDGEFVTINYWDISK